MAEAIDWAKYTAHTPFHKCRGCDRQLAPYQGTMCDECERWSRNQGNPPEDPQFGDPDAFDRGEPQKPNPEQP